MGIFSALFKGLVAASVVKILKRDVAYVRFHHEKERALWVWQLKDIVAKVLFQVFTNLRLEQMCHCTSVESASKLFLRNAEKCDEIWMR